MIAPVYDDLHGEEELRAHHQEEDGDADEGEHQPKRVWIGLRLSTIITAELMAMALTIPKAIPLCHQRFSRCSATTAAGCEAA